MSLTIKGKFIAAGKKNVSKGGTPWQNFWCDLNYDTEFPTQGEFTVFKDKIDLSQFKPGQEIEISFEISGKKNEWQKDGQKKTGFFQSLVAWRVSTETQQSTQESSEDDLPF